MDSRRRQVARALGVGTLGSLAGCSVLDSESSVEVSVETDGTKVVADDRTTSDNFAWAVSSSRDGATALVGASGAHTEQGEYPGAAHVFGRDGDEMDQFGEHLAVSSDGSVVLVAVPNDEDPNGEDGGSAYVFDAADGDWSLRTKLAAADGAADDIFGRVVALSGDGTTAFARAPGDDLGDEEFAGAMYVFDL